MPKIKFVDLPRPLWEHLLQRVQQREVTLEDLQRLRQWVASGPVAPDGPWYKDFGSFKLCGNGEYPLMAAARRSPERKRADPAGNRSPHSKRPTGATRAKSGEPPVLAPEMAAFGLEIG